MVWIEVHVSISSCCILLSREVLSGLKGGFRVYTAYGVQCLASVVVRTLGGNLVSIPERTSLCTMGARSIINTVC